MDDFTLTPANVRECAVGILGASYPDNPRRANDEWSYVPAPLEGDHYSLTEMRHQLIPGCVCGQCTYVWKDVPGGLWCIRYPAGINEELYRERRIRDLFAYHDAEVRGYVYILEAGPYHKIGRTKDPDERIKTLSIQLPFPVKVVHIMACDNEMEAEKTFHNWYAHKRSNGEWFKLTYGEAHSFGSAWINGEMHY